jgi:hypothetical protein
MFGIIDAYRGVILGASERHLLVDFVSFRIGAFHLWSFYFRMTERRFADFA